MSNERETTHSGDEKPVNGSLQKAIEKVTREISEKNQKKAPEKSKKAKSQTVKKSEKKKTTVSQPAPAEAAQVLPSSEQPQRTHEKSLEERDAEYANAYFARANSEEARKQAEENLIKEFYKEGRVVVNPKRLEVESEEGQKMILSALRDAGRKRNFEIGEFKMDNKGVWEMKFKAPTQEALVKEQKNEIVAPVLPSLGQEILAETIVLAKKGEISADEFGRESFKGVRGEEAEKVMEAEEQKRFEAVGQAGRDLMGERQLEKEMAKMPPKEKKQFFRGVAALGFKAQEKKASLFSKTFGGLHALLGKKGEKGLLNEADQGAFTRLFGSYEKIYKEDADSAIKSRKNLFENKKGVFKGSMILGGKTLMWGRTLADAAHLVGINVWAFNPLRYVTLGAMFLGRSFQVGKEARLSSAESMNKTRIHDIDAAHAEALQLVRIAQGEASGEDTRMIHGGTVKDGKIVGGGVSIEKEILAEDYERAFMRLAPEDILNRLKGTKKSKEKSFYPGLTKFTESAFKNPIGLIGDVSKRVAQWDIQHLTEKIAKNIETIDRTHSLTDEEKRKAKDEIIGKYKDFIADADRFVSRSGEIDLLAYGSRLGETAGKKVAVAMAIETLFEGAARGFYALSDLNLFSGGNKATEIPTGSGKAPIKVPVGGGKALVETPVSGGKSELIRPDGDGIWRASRRLIGHGITEDAWREAWKNTFVEIGGEKIHVSEVGLVHKNDSVIFEIGPDEKPFFTVKDNPSDTFSIGTDEDLRNALIREGKIKLPSSDSIPEAVASESSLIEEINPADAEPPVSRDSKIVAEAFVGNDAFIELMENEDIDIDVDREDIESFLHTDSLKEKEEILSKLDKEAEKIFRFIPTKENPEKFPGGFRRSYLALIESFDTDVKAGNLMLLKNLETKFQIEESDFKTLRYMTLNEYRMNMELWEKGGANAVLDDAFGDALKSANAGSFKELLNYIEQRSPNESDGRRWVSDFLKTTDLWKPLPEGKLGVVPPLEMFEAVQEAPKSPLSGAAVAPEAPAVPKIPEPEMPKAETIRTPSGLIDSVKTSAPEYLKGPMKELNLNLLPDSFKALSIAETLQTLQGADMETQKKMLPVFKESLQKMKENPKEYPEAFVRQYEKIISALREHIEKSARGAAIPSEAVKDITQIVVPETFEKVEESPEAQKTETPGIHSVEDIKILLDKLPKSPTSETPATPLPDTGSIVEDTKRILEKLPTSKAPEAPIPEALVTPQAPEPEVPEAEKPAMPEAPTEPETPEAPSPVAPGVLPPAESEGVKEDEGPASIPPESPVVAEKPEEQPEPEPPVVQETLAEQKIPKPEVPESTKPVIPEVPTEPEKVESQVDLIGEAKKTSYTPIQFRRGIPLYLKSIIHSENEEAFRAYGIDKQIMVLSGDINLHEEEQALVRLETLNEKAHTSATTYPKQFLESFDDVIVALAQRVNTGNEHLLENIDSKFKIDKGTYDVLKSITVQHLLDTIALIQDGKISEIPKTDSAMIKLLEEPTKFEYLAAYIQDKHPDAIDKTLSLEVYMKTVGIPDDYERHAGVLWKGLHGPGRAAELVSAGEQLQRISEIAVLEDLRNTYGISQEQYGLVYNMDIGTLLNVMDDIKLGKSGEAHVANDIIRRVLHEKQANFEKLAELIKALNPSLSERTLSLDEYLLEKLPAKTL